MCGCRPQPGLVYPPFTSPKQLLIQGNANLCRFLFISADHWIYLSNDQLTKTLWPEDFHSARHCSCDNALYQPAKPANRRQ